MLFISICPIRSSEVMILTNLPLFYVRKLSFKIQLFWASEFLRRFLNDPTHFYIFVIISRLKRTWPFDWTNLNSLHLRIICFKFEWFWLAGSGEDFSKFSVYFFFSFPIASPWRGAVPFNWTNFNPSSQGWLASSLVKIGAVVLEKKSFKDHTLFLHYCDYLQFEEYLALYLKKLNFLYLRIIFTKFYWIWPAGSGEEDFRKLSVYFYSFAIISPWRRVDPFCLHKLDSPPPPPPG
jgi:hypothetical protein